eukprot:m.375082 g.375082  ORF g.375082 m.375082 type:complete len:61 (-) comp75740_c0_seq1:18-200(-)
MLRRCRIIQHMMWVQFETVCNLGLQSLSNVQSVYARAHTIRGYETSTTDWTDLSVCRLLT